MGITTSDSDIRALNILLGNSSTLGALDTKNEENSQEIIVHADYESGELSIEKTNKIAEVLSSVKFVTTFTNL